MRNKENFSISELRDFSKLFSRKEVQCWLKNDFESLKLKIDKYGLHKKYTGISYLKLLKKVYRILEEKYPNEYIYKNEFLNKWLKHRVGNENSIIINEFRMGKAVADLAMFNGISRVFEIKTPIDKEYRLNNQLKEYKKIFNEVYIVVPDSCVEKYKSFDKSIGIISYAPDIKNFAAIKQPDRNNFIDPIALMEILHTQEYKEIIELYYEELPPMNSFSQFEKCKDLITLIPNEKLNRLFLHIIKRRKINNQIFNTVHKELNQICLSQNLNKQQRGNLINCLTSNII